MFIEPIQIQGIESIGSIGQLGGATGTNKTEDNNLFLKIFEDSVANVRETQEAVTADALAIATGEINELHTSGMNLAKMDLAVSVLVQMRNGFLDAYQELMRISL